MMEMMKLSYYDIVNMPFFVFNSLIKWKIKLEEERKRYLENQKSKTPKFTHSVRKRK